MDFEIIDFHTHPFIVNEDNICAHKDVVAMDKDYTLKLMQSLGVSKFCGSVITTGRHYTFEELKANNDTALELRDYYGGAYIPGFHVHPKFLDESIKEIDRMNEKGVKLVGELVPYFHGYSSYDEVGVDEIIEYATEKDMIISFHSMGQDEMDNMVKRHKKTTFVAAHPGEYVELIRHLERAKMSENYYLDLSGYGIFRYGMLKKAISAMGAERILYGSDYPTCNPAMYLYGVLKDDLVTDTEKELILSKNAKRLLKI